MRWYLKVLGQYVDFHGRARRAEYWMFALVNIAVLFVLTVLDNMLTGTATTSPDILRGIYTLAVLLPSLGVCVRRLHDTGRSGWWLLIALIPIIGTIVLLVFLVTDGDWGPNEHGANPKTP